ncbi:fumarylacetoacetate hydrolase family protein [Motiliproteus sediminis]|uniref:fumarylacetoacetate hydrolase family protein n=1 Tax=Motiliproteus sediminis TaxID=1468178 RepID=UPI001AEFFD14|nr:fumarylacetoacetate hydrolase family protein [Motiliproteus sediminis]
MKLMRFQHQQSCYQGVVAYDRVLVVHNLFERPLRYTGLSFALNQITPLAPCCPGKIICAGINYRAHADDGHTLPSQPLLFLKPASAATGPDCDIPYPALSGRIGFEGELGVVIGSHTQNIDPYLAEQSILGYCCANDVTARDIQEAEDNYGTAKSFPGFAPFGPWIETALDPADLWLETRVNGELRQRAHSSDLLFPVQQLIAYISQVMPLEPGDLILTGTPQGMGDWQPGDRVEVSISGVGTLGNRLATPAATTVADTTLTLQAEVCYG